MLIYLFFFLKFCTNLTHQSVRFDQAVLSFNHFDVRFWRKVLVIYLNCFSSWEQRNKKIWVYSSVGYTPAIKIWWSQVKSKATSNSLLHNIPAQYTCPLIKLSIVKLHTYWRKRRWNHSLVCYQVEQKTLANVYNTRIHV